jgi:hypothetical protein
MTVGNVVSYKTNCDFTLTEEYQFDTEFRPTAPLACPYVKLLPNGLCIVKERFAWNRALDETPTQAVHRANLERTALKQLVECELLPPDVVPQIEAHYERTRAADRARYGQPYCMRWWDSVSGEWENSLVWATSEEEARKLVLTDQKRAVFSDVYPLRLRCLNGVNEGRVR